MTKLKFIQQSHFDGPSFQLELEGGSVPHGYPCFTLSATYPASSALATVVARAEIEPDLNCKRTGPEKRGVCKFNCFTDAHGNATAHLWLPS